MGESLEPPHQSSSNEYPQSMFLAEIWKNISLLSENVVFRGEILYTSE